jgi:hypothetical protein
VILINSKKAEFHEHRNLKDGEKMKKAKPLTKKERDEKRKKHKEKQKAKA